MGYVLVFLVFDVNQTSLSHLQRFQRWDKEAVTFPTVFQHRGSLQAMDADSCRLLQDRALRSSSMAMKPLREVM